MWLQNRLLDTAPQSGLGKAVSYTLKVLGRASRFVEHEFLTPDTNAIAACLLIPWQSRESTVTRPKCDGKSWGIGEPCY